MYYILQLFTLVNCFRYCRRKVLHLVLGFFSLIAHLMLSLWYYVFDIQWLSILYAQICLSMYMLSSCLYQLVNHLKLVLIDKLA